LKKFGSIIFILYLFASSIVLFAQHNNLSYTTKMLGQADGLSQASNYFNFEDSKGFMWITAPDAINRYDGSHIKVYNLNKYFKNCQALQQGYGFAEDANANIYIGSDKGIYKYSRILDQFELLSTTKKQNQTMLVIGSYQNKIWCCNASNEIICYNINKNIFETKGKFNGPSSNSFHVYAVGTYEKYPILTSKGHLYIFDNNVQVFDCNTSKVRTILQIDKNRFWASTLNKQGNTIYLCAQNEIYEISDSNIIINIHNYNLQGIHKRNILNIYASKDFIIYKARFTSYIKQISTNKIATVKQYGSNGSFDNEGQFWMDINGKGFEIINLQQNPFHFTYALNQNNEYIGIGDLSQLVNGNIYLHQNIQSVDLEKDNNILSSITLNDSKEPGLLKKTILDTNRNIAWCINGKYSTEDYFFYKYEFGYIVKENKFILLQDISNIFKSTSLKSVEMLGKHHVLFCGNDGLYTYHITSKRFAKILPNTLKLCFQINILSPTTFAVSTLNKKMYLIELNANNEFIIKQIILEGIQVFYINYHAQTQTYWVGADDGVYILDKHFKTIKKLDANDGLEGTYIFGLLIDDFNTVWLSHQRGMSAINCNTYKVINYTPEDGLQGYDFNNRAFLKTVKGLFVFGGSNGLNWFKPPLHLAPKSKPTVYIDEFLCNEKNYMSEFNLGQAVGFKANQTNLEVRAYICDLQQAVSQHIVYKLNDEPLQVLSNKGIINFLKLAVGDYTLKLGYINRFLDKPQWQKEYQFSIAAYFYKQTWFIILCTLLLSGFVFYLFNYFKTKKVQQKVKAQQALNTQRQQITADLHDDIGATLSSIQVNSNVANQLLKNNRQANAENILNKIEQQAQEVSEKISHIIWAIKPNAENNISLQERIKQIVYTMLSDTGIKYKVQIDEQIENEITSFTQRKNILLICKEAINNILKYSKAKEATIIFTKDDKTNIICLTITDNGIGFDPTLTKGNGIGNIHARAQEMNGVCVITSYPNVETKIQIQFDPT
jgi:signal transduction histidine kinase